MKYFSKIVMIRYACGHKKLGIDTYQSFVTENKIKCPKCCKVSSKDTAKQIFRKWEKAGGKFSIAVKLVKMKIRRSKPFIILVFAPKEIAHAALLFHETL